MLTLPILSMLLDLHQECWCLTKCSLFQLKEEKMKADLEAPLPAGQEDFAIRCRDVCRSYGKLKVLNNLNLAVPQGQM